MTTGPADSATKLFRDFMVDIETTGLEPNRHAIIQLSAVPFNYETREIAGVFFDKCLAIPNWRHCQESTMRWWHSKNPEVFNEILSRMESPGPVMHLFAQFVREVSGYDPIKNEWPGDAEPRFWYKRPFDWQFTEGYFKDFEAHSPFHYHNAIEMTAYLKGVAHTTAAHQVAVEPEGPLHNAYYDCRLQIRKLFATLDYYNGVPHEPKPTV